MRTVIAMKPADSKGLAVIRAVLAQVHAAHKNLPAEDLASSLYGANVVSLVKDAQSTGRYSDFGSSERSTAEFFAAVREESVLGKLRARRVGMRVRTLFATTPIAATWIRPGHAMPVGRTIWSPNSLSPLYVGALTVLTRETIEAAIGRDPSPSRRYAAT